MLHLLHANRTDEARLPRRLVTDRQNPFTAYSEEEFIQRYRLSKECIRTLLEQVEPHVPRAQDGRGRVTFNSLLLPLRFFLNVMLACSADNGELVMLRAARPSSPLRGPQLDSHGRMEQMGSFLIPLPLFT